MLPNEAALALSIDPGQMDGALTLDEPNYLDTAYFGGIEKSICT